MLHMNDMSLNDEEKYMSGSAADLISEILIKTIQGLFTGTAGGQ